MLSALGLSLGQLADRRILRVLGKSALVTLALFVVLGALGWWGLDTAFIASGLRDDLASGTQTLRVLIAGVIVLIGVWLLFRLVAIAVVQFFADEVVAAVEARHYPALAATARPLGWRAEARQALRGLVRSVMWNLAALPVAVVLLVTGLGPALVFFVVNAVLLGRELTDMVRLRHRDAAGTPAAPPPAWQRLLLGGTVAGLLAVPFLNLVAPVIGAATATHLVLRRHTGVSDAP
ncbi:EI24 domain-containing protein [Novosphingobium sp. EMRT-2]|uniref:EI24 domain-containing protein n=1 Tax=Novosphingobium sp. EMRT-2 TaxID=2571749 RepID=UPI0010BD8322|nr:EI24 domain-containing protein [Novosphingobium sp. EMRT-2]QCI94052.1 hypothetical protein FA702_11190 [Novosphingobium sp. EMRT-2]